MKFHGYRDANRVLVKSSPQTHLSAPNKSCPEKSQFRCMFLGVYQIQEMEPNKPTLFRT